MAHVVVASDDQTLIVELETDDDAYTSALCPVCGELLTDRGNFGDTAEIVGIHLDNHAGRGH